MILYLLHSLDEVSRRLVQLVVGKVSIQKPTDVGNNCLMQVDVAKLFCFYPPVRRSWDLGCMPISEGLVA